MIQQKTVFILGAGASAPFKFPTGYALLKQVYELTDSSNGQNDLTIYEQCGFSIPQINRFRDLLIKSQKLSIDAFLEHRTEFIPLGKCLITKTLLAYENLESIYENPDWYIYLWNKLNSSFENFNENQVSFVTFNYDRSLEVYLLKAMISLYDKPKAECIESLNKIPIIHVHGTLGKTEIQSPVDFTEFGKEIGDFKELLEVSRSIKIVHESINTDNEFRLAHELIVSADQVIILGLGCDDNNLRRLKMDSTNAKILGSSFDLTANECDIIMHNYPKIKVTKYTSRKNLEFLRNEISLS